MIKFSNGKTLDTIAVYGGTMQYQNAQRKTLEIVCGADAITLDEAKELYRNRAALSEITVETEGETSVHPDFTLPVELKLTEQDGADVIHIKLAQKSALEIAQEQQMAEINDTQLALIELAGMMTGGESNG